MTVLLVLFLIVAFVGTDHVVHAVSRRAEAKREDPLRGPARLSLPTGSARLQGAENHGPLRP
jgi:hypothetical protein